MVKKVVEGKKERKGVIDNIGEEMKEGNDIYKKIIRNMEN